MLSEKDREFASLPSAGRVGAEEGLEEDRAAFPAKQVYLDRWVVLGDAWMEPACPLSLPRARFPGQVVTGHGGAAWNRKRGDLEM